MQHLEKDDFQKDISLFKNVNMFMFSVSFDNAKISNTKIPQWLSVFYINFKAWRSDKVQDKTKQAIMRLSGDLVIGLQACFEG